MLCYFCMAQIYNDRRLFFGGGPGIVPDTFGSVASSSPNSDRRNSRSRGMLDPITFISCFYFQLQFFPLGIMR